jgi:hypothetical protein
LRLRAALTWPLARLAGESLLVEAVDTETGQRREGTIYRDQWA